MAADESGVKRFLCSELVVLSTGGRRWVVNLEEIWRTGAVVECEEEPRLGEQAVGGASLIFGSDTPAGSEEAKGSAPPCALVVAVVSVEKHEFGWRMEVRFVDGEWTPAIYTPAHLTDVDAIAAAARNPE